MANNEEKTEEKAVKKNTSAAQKKIKALEEELQKANEQIDSLK